MLTFLESIPAWAIGLGSLALVPVIYLLAALRERSR
jgi:hypothetical protein